MSGTDDEIKEVMPKVLEIIRGIGLKCKKIRKAAVPRSMNKDTTASYIVEFTLSWARENMPSGNEPMVSACWCLLLCCCVVCLLACCCFVCLQPCAAMHVPLSHQALTVHD